MPTIILFAPLIGALICGFGWRFMGEKAAMTTATALLFLSCLLSWVVFLTFTAHGGGAGAEHAWILGVANAETVAEMRPRRSPASMAATATACSAGSCRARWPRTGRSASTG